MLARRAADSAWVPDGGLVAFAAGRGVEVVTAAGRSRRLVVRGGFDPAWSPDGARLVFAVSLPTARAALLVALVAGGARRRITSPPGLRHDPGPDRGPRGPGNPPGETP